MEERENEDSKTTAGREEQEGRRRKEEEGKGSIDQGPVVQNFVSLTSLRPQLVK